MKGKIKFLSIIMACAVAFGALGVPTIAKSILSADTSSSTLVKSDVFAVKKPETVVYEVGQSYTFLEGADYQLWAPDGTVLVGFGGTKGTSYQFNTAGLYSYQYRTTDGKGLVILSDQYFIPVEGKTSDSIILTETISSVAKTGTLVTVPKTSTANVTVRVYSPYGKLVKEIVGDDRTFSNISNVKGTYYIEYSKNDGAIVKYLTVDFGDDYRENELKAVDELYFFEYSDDLTEISKNSLIYMFRNYELSAKAYDINGRELTGGDYSVVISVDDSEGNSIRVEKFSDAEITDLTKEGAKKYTIKVELKKGTEVLHSKTIEAKAKFNSDCFVVKFDNDEIVKDFLTLDELKATAGYSIPNAKLVWAEGYSAGGDVETSEAKLAIKLVYTDDTSINLGSSDDNFLDLTSPSDEESESASTNYIIKAKAEVGEFSTIDSNKKNITVRYSYTYEATAISSNYTWEKTKSIKIVKDASDKADVVAPKFGSFPEYECVVAKGGEFIVPTVTATDKLNSDADSNGVKMSVKCKGVNAPVNIKMGDTVTLPGDYSSVNYEFVYTAEDSSGNTTEKSIYVRVLSSGNLGSSPIYSDASVTIEKNDEEITFNFNNVCYVEEAVLYIDGEKATSPKKVVYDTRLITSLTIDATDKNFILVVKRNYINDNGVNECQYVTLGLSGKTTLSEIVPYSFNYIDENDSYQATLYSEVVAYVGDSIIWPYSNNFTIEANCKYSYKDCVIVPQTAGTITITDNATKKSAKITVKTGPINSPTFYTASNQVVAVKDDNGVVHSKDVEVKKPYIPNYFGYKLTTTIASAKGGDVVLDEHNKINISAVDKFTIKHLFSYEGMTSSASEVISSGNVEAPKIQISEPYNTTIWNGESARIDIISASAIDKFGKTLHIGQDGIVVKDSSGKIIETQKDGNNLFVTVTSAGIYSVSYTVTDSDGISAIETVNFLVVFPEKAEAGMSAWAIVGIVLGSIAGAGLVAFVVYICIKNNKKQKKFINKNRQAKKAESAEQVLYTIAENKDGSVWTVKFNNRVIAKEKSKEDALAKIESKRATNVKIKVYNSTGRLIDSIEK